MSILSIAFTIVVGSALFRGLDISCGCFYAYDTEEIIEWTYMAQDLCLLIMGLQVLFFDNGRYILTASTPRNAKERYDRK